MTHLPFARMIYAVGLALLISLTPANSQEGEETATEELVVLGSRTAQRTAIETAFAVDFLMRDELAETNRAETGRAIQSLAPAFNFPSTTVADGTDVLKPATLRGLGPDQTLVLINGLRRHKSALLHVNSSVGRGTAGTDLNAIAPSFIEGVEILRDGAAALYGSDAIAGVINIRLREDPASASTELGGGEFIVSHHQTLENDGEQRRLALNYGFRLPHNGFLFMGYEGQDKGHTNRSGLLGTLFYSPPAGTSDASTCNANDNSGCDPREFTTSRRRMIAGDPDSLAQYGVVNMGFGNADVDWRGFALWSKRDNTSRGFFRQPNDDGRNVLAVYPDGFLPEINTDIEDLSFSSTLTGHVGDWDLTLSALRGENNFDFYVSNSLNASFGDDSPRGASAGGLVYGEDIIDFTANGALSVWFDFATGLVWKRERYEIEAGEIYSYANCHDLSATELQALGDDGNCAFQSDGTTQKVAGIQVFPGFEPSNERKEDRKSLAWFAEASRQWGAFTGNVALRWEDYEDTDGIWSGRLGARYAVDAAHAIRGSLSNGFRAPSLQQIYFNNTITELRNGQLVQSGHFTNDSALVRQLGVPRLKEERALSFGVGYVYTPRNDFSFTIDAYQIEIDDRIVISGSLVRDELLLLPAAADPSSDIFRLIQILKVDNNISNAQFMMNGPDTRTRGLEFVAVYAPRPKNIEGELDFKWTGHYTKTEAIGAFNPPGLLSGLRGEDIFTARERSIIEEWQPRYRWSWTTDYTMDLQKYGSLKLTGIVNHYGSYVASDLVNGALMRQKFSDAFIVDMRVAWQITPKSSLSLYGDNIFDRYPERTTLSPARAGTISGIVDNPNGAFQYSRFTAPYGFNGASWGLQFKQTF